MSSLLSFSKKIERVSVFSCLALKEITYQSLRNLFIGIILLLSPVCNQFTGFLQVMSTIINKAQMGEHFYQKPYNVINKDYLKDSSNSNSIELLTAIWEKIYITIFSRKMWREFQEFLKSKFKLTLSNYRIMYNQDGT